MHLQHVFGTEGQKPPLFALTSRVGIPPSGGVRAGESLGSDMLRSALQMGGKAARGTLSKLEELKRRRFPPEGKAERVARALAALDQEETMRLTPEQWKRIAEDPDLEDQF